MFRPNVSQFQASQTTAANGRWLYVAGAAGVVTPPQGAYLVSVACFCAAGAGTCRVGAVGDLITIPAGAALSLTPNGGWVGDGIDTITFAGTTSYVMEFVL
jgi:hypothetical protein